MKRPLSLLGVCLVACGGPSAPAPVALPPLPPLRLVPQIATLKALAATLPQPTPAEQKELRELTDIALQLVEADARTAARAERALLEHPFGAAALEPALQHEAVGVRRRAAWLCGRTTAVEATLPLLLRLKYELDPETVLWVADALQRLGNDAGLTWLDAAMQNQATADQAGALTIEICRERGVALAEAPSWTELQTHLRTMTGRWLATGQGGRAAAPKADPARLEPALAAHLATTEGTLLRPIDDAKYILSRSGVLAVPLLERTLQASEPYLRTVALELLASLGPCAAGTGAAVLPLLGDPLTGSYAMRTLGETGHQPAVPHLRARLELPDIELRAAAVMALGLLRDEGSRAALQQKLAATHEALDVRVGAAFGLLCLGNDAAAEAFLAAREQAQDYHAPTLRRLRERLQRLGR